MADNVNHPSHYQGTFECIDEMKALFPREWVKGFCACNAYKYKYRAGKKVTSSKDEDMSKADWYMKELMKMQEEDAVLRGF